MAELEVNLEKKPLKYKNDKGEDVKVEVLDITGRIIDVREFENTSVKQDLSGLDRIIIAN